MSSLYFTGEYLQPPRLRFNASSLQAQHQDARQGLKSYGPYDAQRLAKDRIEYAIIYPDHLSQIKDMIVSGLIKGNGQFGGFKSLFRIPLEVVTERSVHIESEDAIKEAIITTLRDHRPDIFVLVTSTRNEALYRSAKALLLGNGMPNQVIRAETIRNSSGLTWSLENIALQIYAKIGGTPWTVMSSSSDNELVIGVSRAVDSKRNTVVGFITLFTRDGDYRFLYSLSPRPINWERLDEYRNALAQLIVKAYQEYRRQSVPSKLVIHLCKRPGKFREVAAVEQAMQNLGQNIPFALMHLNDDTSYRLFDTAHTTYVPKPGIKVDLNRYTALLFLDGRVQDKQGREIRRKRGVPRVLEVYLDQRSTVDANEFPRLVRQVFDFARVNWRGFNAQAVPATLNYSYLVARLVSEIGADDWNVIASAVSLRDKAWFL